MPSTKSKAKQKAKLVFEAIGTQWQIELLVEANQLSRIADKITKRILEFDKTYSRFRPTSWLMRTGREIGAHKVPADFDKMYRFYEQMYKLTNGQVTPLIGEVMEGAGYDAEYSFKPGKIVRPKKLNDVLVYNNYTLHVKYKTVIDFGAAGKGFLIDVVSDLIKAEGITDYLIDAGGDILAHSPAPTPVGLENPTNFNQVLGIAQIGGKSGLKSLCASAGNRRKWANWHHIINPLTLKPVDEIMAVWVVADTTMLADGLATCLFFVEPSALLNDFNFEYFILKRDNTYQVSEKFPGEIFTQNN